ncbi:MAG: 50S ribosomal protein L29 [Bacteroidia bacterium]
MKKEDIKELTDKEIQEYIVEEQLSLTKMGLTHAVHPLDNPKKLSFTKRMIARYKTELRARQLKKQVKQ